MSVYDISGNELVSGVEIKPYFENEMNDTVNKVRNAANEPSLIFPVVTDIHRYSADTPQNFDAMVDNISKFAQLVRCDFVINLGDSIDGQDTQAVSLEQAYSVTEAFRKIGAPCLYAHGNHDNNPYTTSGSFSNREFDIYQCFKAFFLNVRGVKVNASENGTDYYIDFDGIGVRAVVLNSSNVKKAKNYGYGNSTATWLANVALDTDYTVLLMEHISSISTQVWNNTAGTNYGGITSAIQAFINGGGTIIQLSGHSHVDTAFIDPWVAIGFVCQKCSQADISTTEMQKISGYIDTLGSPTRTVNTATEDAWTVCILKPFSNELDTIRFGAGADRYFHYAPIAPTTLTSKLSGTLTWSSSDLDVATVSNGVVTGVASGTCAIIAKDESGNYEAWVITVS